MINEVIQVDDIHPRLLNWSCHFIWYLILTKMIYCEWTLLHKSLFFPCHLQLQTLLFSNFHHLQPTNISHAMVHWWCTPLEMLLLLHIIIAYWIVEVNEAFALIYHQFLKGCVMFGPLCGSYKTLCNMNWMDYLHPYTSCHFLWLCRGLVFEILLCSRYHVHLWINQFLLSCMFKVFMFDEPQHFDVLLILCL